MSDKKDLENKEEELNLDEELEQELDFEEESEDEQEEEFEEESENEQEEEFEEESEDEQEEEFEEESEDEQEEEFEEESEDEQEEEFEEESEDEQEEEFEEESEEVENKRDTKRLVVYGVGAIALAGIGFVGYNTFFAKPTYVMPDKSSTVSSSNQYDYAEDPYIEDSYVENDSDVSLLIDEEDSVHVDSHEQSLDHETTNYNDDINITPEHHYEGSETYEMEAQVTSETEGEVLGHQQAENVVSLTQSEYDSLIERIERLESLVADNEEQIVNLENRFNVFDELISTMDNVNERIGQVEEDVNQIQESFDIIKDLQESYKNISHEFEEIKESESQSSSVAETPVEKNDVVVERNSEVEERTSNNASSTNTQATTTQRSSYIPESQRPAIPNWKGVAKIDNGQMIGIDLGDGRFITLVEGEPVRVYGPVQRIASDGTVYFRTHKINFIQ